MKIRYKYITDVHALINWILLFNLNNFIPFIEKNVCIKFIDSAMKAILK